VTAFILNQWIPVDGCACAGGDANTPVNTSIPVVSGNIAVGQILTCSAGVWDGIPTTFVYQWQRDGTNISAATHSTYTLVLADSLHAIRCVVSAINIFGATSIPSNTVTVPYPTPVNLSAPAVSGTAKVGQTLTCSQGAWDNSPTSFTFQWQRDAAVNVGTGSTYVLVNADDGQSISCIVTATSPGGIASATSNSVSITRFAPTNTATPIVTGNANPFSTLSCSQGTWTDFPTSYAYQWLRDGTAISGATSTTYTAVLADELHAVSCAVTASNSGGPSTPAASNAIVIQGLFSFPTANLVALYSVRKCGSGYAGKCVNVRRQSDNSTLDIGFAVSSGLVDMTAALTFAAGAPLYITKWYDQSGNGLDASQASAANQPQLLLIGGNPWISCGSISQGPDHGQMLSTAAPITLTGDQTIGMVSMLGSDLSQVPMHCYDGSNGWLLTFNGLATHDAVGSAPGKFSYWSQTGTETIDSTNLFPKSVHQLAVTRTSGTMQFYVDGAATTNASGKGNAASTAPMSIGGLDLGSGGYPFEGLLAEVYVYGAALSSGALAPVFASEAATFPDTGFATPYNGTSSVQFGYGEQIVCGDVLNYERTASWTAYAAVQLYNTPGSGAALIYTNVPTGNAAFPGHEFWVDGAGLGGVGQLRVRIMHDIGGGNYIDVRGSTLIVDGRKHMIAYSYDGSSTAAGVKIYVDGVLETMTALSNTLTGSIVAGGQNLVIGNQQGIPNFNLRGTIDHFQIDNIAQTGAYIATYINGAVPPVAAGHTDIRFTLNEGAGATANDGSGNSRNGALTTSTMWVP
jgi:Concanavalin A-like lectin/glucanases superfamily